MLSAEDAEHDEDLVLLRCVLKINTLLHPGLSTQLKMLKTRIRKAAY